MNKKIIWSLGILIALSVVLVANAAQLNESYLPLVYKNKITTIIVTPTPTKTPKPTSTPAPGQCLSGKTSGLCITNIDYKPSTGGSLNESITIKNLGSSSVDMEDWRVLNDKSEKFEIPIFSLKANSTVKVWTKVGTDDSSNLYMDLTTQFWNDVNDCAYLRDDSHPRKTIDAVCYGFTGSFYAPVLDESP